MNQPQKILLPPLSSPESIKIPLLPGLSFPLGDNSSVKANIFCRWGREGSLKHERKRILSYPLGSKTVEHLIRVANHITSQLRFILHRVYHSLTKCWLLYNFSAKPGSFSPMNPEFWWKIILLVLFTLYSQTKMAWQTYWFFLLWPSNLLPLPSLGREP